MTSKRFLLATAFFIAVLISPAIVKAQQNRSSKGNLFVRQQLSPAQLKDLIESLLRRPNRIRLPFRSYDGTNNNIGSTQKALWGSTDIPLFRELPAWYGPSDPNNAMGGPTLPSARRISNAVSHEPVTQFNERGLSAFVYVWGQFLDHDMSQTPTGNTEYVPIALPGDEPTFTVDIPFFRSLPHPGTGINNTVRQQTNLNTAWIDGSVVYGSDAARARWMRTMRDGKMKTSKGNFLPWNTITGELDAPIDPNAPDMANDSNHTVKTFVAGDVRAAEHPGISSLHTIFVREHNRICDQLIKQGLRNDELLYQAARKQVGALIEAITYQEFLPAIGIALRPYKGYDNDARGDLANTFATAGYRLGHTMVADDLILKDNLCNEVEPGEFDLIDVFWTPQIILEIQMEPFLKGFATHKQYETDTKINDVLRDFLFVSANNPVRFGIDLASLNIQRGRDHGLPPYNVVRKFYTGKAAAGFSDITTKQVIADSLKSLYGSVDNVDLWVGILAEDHIPGTSIGKTLHEMLRVQFEKLRDGDFYFYRNDPFLSPLVKNQVSNTKLSDVLKRNTTLTNVQSNLFFIDPCPGEDGEDARIAVTKELQQPVTESGKTITRVYPNPASELINVDLGNQDETSTIRIFTTNGELMKTIVAGAHQGNIPVNISGLTKGMYIIRISNSKEIKSLKFVKL